MARYCAPEEALPLLDEADAALQATVAGFGEADLTHDSLCQGWTRAQVLAHVARNAEALGRLVTWATSGEETPGYSSPEQRDADIAAGARQESAVIKTDLARTAQALRPRLDEVVGRADLAQVRTSAASAWLPGDQVPWARLREVVVHHVDLDAGFSFADADPQVVELLLDEAVDRLGARWPSGAAGVSLVAADTQRRWDLAGGGQVVRGLPGSLLLWLARGVERDLRHDEPLPPLPPWG